MLKKAVQRDKPWRVKRKTCEKGAIRGSTFGVRSSENLELRTSNPPPSRLSRQSRLAILRGAPDVQAIEVLQCRNGFSAALGTGFPSGRLGFQYPKPRVLERQHQPLSRLLK